MDNNDDEKEKKSLDFDFFSFIIKNKKAILSVISTLAPIIGLLLIGALIVALVASVPTAFSETIYGWITSVTDAIDSALGDVGDSWYMFTSNYEKNKMEKAEQAYYNKLQKVYKQFKDDYDVEIDTTMITSTLFFGRTLEMVNDEVENGDLNNIVDSEGNTTAEEGTKSWYKQQTDLYKKAKANIKKLAYYQIVVTVTSNACVSEEKVYSGTKPETDKEIAENWEHPYKYDSYFVNIRTNYNYVESSIATKDNKIGICPFDDAESTLRAMFEADKLTYEEKKLEYESCVSYYESCYEQYGPGHCGGCDKEEEEYGAAEAQYMSWINEGLFDEEGTFNCISTDSYGTLDRYDDAKKYRNYNIDTDLLSPTAESFVQSLEYFDKIGKKCNGSTCSDTNCSQRPSMNVQYTVELAREGVYYWRLLSYNEEEEKEDDRNSFIKSYYFSDIDVTPEDEIEQVELIFDNFETWSERKYNKGFGAFVCLDYASDGAGGTGAGDPTTWKQTDSRWSGIGLGSSTLGSVGCFVTSWTIQLALSFQANPEALLAATGCASIDPGSIATYLAANGAFTSDGSLQSLASLEALFPGIQFGSTSISGSMEDKAAEFQKMIAAGKQPIVRVKYGDAGQHWVAVTGVDSSGNIQIADPGYNKTSLSEWTQTAGVTLDVRYVTTS